MHLVIAQAKLMHIDHIISMNNHNMDFLNYLRKIVAFTVYFTYKLCYNGSLNWKRLVSWRFQDIKSDK